jgi:hypothetical protein
MFLFFFYFLFCFSVFRGQPSRVLRFSTSKIVDYFSLFFFLQGKFILGFEFVPLSI